MKVVSCHQMSALESLAYRNGSSESDFMEEAGSGVALVVHDFVEKYNLNRTVVLLCGKGNNGGDAYVAGIHLLHLDYDVVAIQAVPISTGSNLCKINYERFLNEGGRVTEEALSEFPANSIIVDGLFGTGFRGTVEEPYAALIRLANGSGLPIIAVDIPSGLDGETGRASGEAIIARETAFLGLPKKGFFLGDGWKYVGRLRYVDFGLPKHYIESCASDMRMLSDADVQLLLPPIKRNRHKYEAGLVVGLAGSPGMPGAAMLASTAALRGGAGIVRLLHPEGMQAELAMSPYELIRLSYHYEDTKEIIDQMNRAAATFIGPGLGLSQQVRNLLRTILPELKKPCVIDADALTIIAEEGLAFPERCIITPHHGEMMRLLKTTTHPALTEEFLATCANFASAKNVTLVLKGAPTFIIHPDQPYIVNPTGDPGMATAGSGDVLTGLLTGLLAQGMATNDAACLGVFLHGLAGEHAAEEMTSYGVMASDIIYHFPEAFKFFLL